MYSNLLVPTDGSKLSGKAVAHATGLAKALKAKITVLYVTPAFAPESRSTAAALWSRVCRKRITRR